MASNNYLGEIRMFAGTTAPSGWAICDGSVRSTTTDSSLFSLLGNRYGGDGVTTFRLPDLRGRAPIHTGAAAAANLGHTGGVESVLLALANLPSHAHPIPVNSATAGVEKGPQVLGTVSGSIPDAYTTAGAANRILDGTTLTWGTTETTTAHENMQPWLAINYIIALTGDIPGA